MTYKNPFAPQIVFPSDVYLYVREIIIQPKVNEFLQSRNVQQAVELEGSTCITDLDFRLVKIGYFYQSLLRDLKREGDIIKPIYYTITYDKKLAVLKCEDTGLPYNALYLGNKPILYFIYFNLQEVLDAARIYAQQ